MGCYGLFTYVLHNNAPTAPSRCPGLSQSTVLVVHSSSPLHLKHLALPHDELVQNPDTQKLCEASPHESDQADTSVLAASATAFLSRLRKAHSTSDTGQSSAILFHYYCLSRLQITDEDQEDIRGAASSFNLALGSKSYRAPICRSASRCRHSLASALVLWQDDHSLAPASLSRRPLLQLHHECPCFTIQDIHNTRGHAQDPSSDTSEDTGRCGDRAGSGKNGATDKARDGCSYYAVAPQQRRRGWIRTFHFMLSSVRNGVDVRLSVQLTVWEGYDTVVHHSVTCTSSAYSTNAYAPPHPSKLNGDVPFHVPEIQ